VDMTKIALALFFALPSVSFAAALTPQQSSSLIAVVQSSPGTPASAFVSLITAFSNITVTQATSLITVVQVAPGVPANAFVDLLTSFTADTVATQIVTPVVTPTVITQTVHGTHDFWNSPIPTGPITINPSILTQTWRRNSFYATSTPLGFILKGSAISLWENELVMQGGQNIWDGIDITYSLDGKVLGSPTGILGNYTFPFDTTKYSNGPHQVGISVDDGRGNTASKTLDIDIEN